MGRRRTTAFASRRGCSGDEPLSAAFSDVRGSALQSEPVRSRRLARLMRAQGYQALTDRRCPMYWLLLPLEANAQRHFADETGPSSNYWARLWAALQGLL